MEGWEILLGTCASECAPSRRLHTQAMHGGIRVCSNLYRPNAGMIETDNIKGRDLGALKQNREKTFAYWPS